MAPRTTDDPVEDELLPDDGPGLTEDAYDELGIAWDDPDDFDWTPNP